MGINFLRPFLESICCNSRWDYAVFWKLKHQNGMDLVWEDGFCEIQRDSMVSPIEDSYLDKSNKPLFSTFNSTVLDGTHGDYSVGLAVTEMSNDSHVLGKGVVGKAAFTGNAFWIYSDNITDVFNSVLVPEYPDEWLLQFVAGIKTILLLPVMPHGVLQLGSVEMVAEDAALVAHLKDKFEAYRKHDPNDPKYSTEQFSLLSTFTQNLEEPSEFFTEKEIEDQNAIHAVRTLECNLVASQIMPVFMIQDFCNTSMRQVTDTPENPPETVIIPQPIGTFHVPEPCELSSEDYKFPITENDILSNFHHGENSRFSSYVEKYEMTMYSEFVNELMDFNFEDGITEPTFLGHDFDSTICDAYQYTNGISISPHDAARNLIGDREPSCSLNVSAVESVGCHMKEVELEHLLEAAAAANPTVSLDNDSSINSNITSLDMSPEKDFASSKKHDHSKGGASMEEDKLPWNFSTSAFFVQGPNCASNLSASVSPIESKISSSFDKRQKRKGYNSVNREKLSIPTTNNKRRAPPGDNRRQRPRDRQLIQERIKELRELVPNSEKCSIDGLLDKTIKHMLFLRDVTNQADKLRQQVSDEEADERTVDSEVSYSHQNGTSWAVELGSEQQLCPIVVKDLDQPGHMLIEMLCNDHDRFLEISDAIHRLKLTILKGVMEKTTDNSWARFIVETSGSFHRLDIFWPLMQLLQHSQVPV